MQRDSEITVDELFFCERALKASIARSQTFQGNYAIDRNLERVEQALRPVRKRMFEEPMRWHFNSQIQGAERKPLDRGKKNLEVPSPEQISEGKKAFEECLQERVGFEPYRVAANKVGDGLKKLSPKREILSDEQLSELEEDLYVAFRILGVLKGEEGE